MKLRFLICAALLAGAFTTTHAAQKGAPQIQSVRINGYVGDRIDKCIEHVTMPVDVDRLVQPFRAQDETQNRWQGEFWGKWVQGAIASYRYNGDAALYEKIKNSVDLMIATQLPDGYMGNYDKQHQLQGWDVWGRKYTTLGLLKWYDLSGDKKALDAACRLIDYTITQIGPGATPVYKTGCYKGMASGSILEPVVMLYNATKNPKYLDFAKHLAQSLDEKGGPQLITLADTRLDRRFPVEEPDMWWSNENGQKAYEMMSCYVGFLELYKVTGEKRYLDAVEAVMKHIMDEETYMSNGGIRSLSRDEKMYNLEPTGNPSNWLGPIWIISQYCVFRGLMNYGYVDEARVICDKTLKLLGEDLKKTGDLHEYYNPETCEPIMNPGFVNWNVLALAMADELDGKPSALRFVYA